MKRTQSVNNQSSNRTHRSTTQRSNTLNRKYVHKPTMDTTPKQPDTVKINIVKSTPQPAPKPKHTPSPAQELKERAIKEAMNQSPNLNQQPKQQKEQSKKPKKQPKQKTGGGAKRFFFAFVCATVCVAAIIFFVNINKTDISTRINALQNGINAVTPTYIPRDYSSSDISSENGKISMTFSGPKDASFSITEEKSSWDSQALLNNYVKTEYGEDYTTTHEKGITVYMSNKEAVWVNGGIKFTLKNTTGSLTKKQISSIIASM